MNFNKIDSMKKEALNYLIESRKYVYLATSIFFLFIVLGFIFEPYLGFLDEVLKNLVSKVALLKGFEVALFIFANNVQAALVGLVAGVFIGIIPLFNLISNGTVVGYVFARVSDEIGFAEIWKILPHGVFELPAIFISLGLGIKLGMSFFNKRPIRTLKDRLYLSMLVFLFIIIPLLLLAACIEGMLIDILE